MTLSYGKILSCPYCQAEREVMELSSGNTFGAKFWSDNRCVAPMLPYVSPVLKCPECGMYYFRSEASKRSSDNYSFDDGRMSYEEWKEAYAQFLDDELQEPLLSSMRIWLVQAFNDRFYRSCETDDPSAEEQQYIDAVILDLIASREWRDPGSIVFKAELYREAGQMELCTLTLDETDTDGHSEMVKKAVAGMRERVKSGDRRVFVLS